MKLSVMSYTLNTLGWFKENKTEGLKKICDLAVDLDIEGIDWVSTYGIASKEIRRAMDDHGLKTVCHTFGVPGLNCDTFAERSAAVDSIRGGVEDALVLATDKVMLVTPGNADVPRDISRRNYIRGLQECAVCVRQAGLVMTIENFPGSTTPFAVSSDVLEAVREVDGLKLTYDNGNVYIGGEDPAVSFTRCAEHVVHAHFKDWDNVPAGQGKAGLDGRQYTSALIGEGVVDHKSCIAAMKAAGYTGYINLEYEGNKYPRDEGTRRAANYLNGLIGETAV